MEYARLGSASRPPCPPDRESGSGFCPSISLQKNDRRFWSEPGRQVVAQSKGTGRAHDNTASCRSVGTWLARHTATASCRSDRSLYVKGRRYRNMGTAFHLSRLPLRGSE